MNKTTNTKSEATTATHKDRQPIGAWITYRFNDMAQSLIGYVSFGEYLEDAETDSHGINDDEIFFYLSAAELKEKLASQEYGDEWKVISIDQYIY